MLELSRVESRLAPRRLTLALTHGKSGPAVGYELTSKMQTTVSYCIRAAHKMSVASTRGCQVKRVEREKKKNLDCGILLHVAAGGYVLRTYAPSLPRLKRVTIAPPWMVFYLLTKDSFHSHSSRNLKGRGFHVSLSLFFCRVAPLAVLCMSAKTFLTTNPNNTAALNK